jgi:hypothetical protein
MPEWRFEPEPPFGKEPGLGLDTPDARALGADRSGLLHSSRRSGPNRGTNGIWVPAQHVRPESGERSLPSGARVSSIFLSFTGLIPRWVTAPLRMLVVDSNHLQRSKT